MPHVPPWIKSWLLYAEETNVKDSSPVKEKSESSTVATPINPTVSTPEGGGATTEKVDEEEEESDEDIL